MPARLKIYRKPTDPNRVFAEYGPHRSSYLIIRNADGKICAPWVMEEMAQINTKRGTMDWVSFKGLEEYRKWALENVQQEIKKSTEERLL